MHHSRARPPVSALLWQCGGAAVRRYAVANTSVQSRGTAITSTDRRRYTLHAPVPPQNTRPTPRNGARPTRRTGAEGAVHLPVPGQPSPAAAAAAAAHSAPPQPPAPAPTPRTHTAEAGTPPAQPPAGCSPAGCGKRPPAADASPATAQFRCQSLHTLQTQHRHASAHCGAATHRCPRALKASRLPLGTQ